MTSSAVQNHHQLPINNILYKNNGSDGKRYFNHVSETTKNVFWKRRKPPPYKFCINLKKNSKIQADLSAFDDNKCNHYSPVKNLDQERDLNNNRKSSLRRLIFGMNQINEVKQIIPRASLYSQLQERQKQKMNDQFGYERERRANYHQQLPSNLDYLDMSSEKDQNPCMWWQKLKSFEITFHFEHFFVVLAIFHIFASLGLFVFAVLRFYHSLQSFKREFSGKNVFFLDFAKAEDYAGSNREGTSIIAIKAGASVFVPATLQFVSSILALFPLCRRPPKFYMILELILASYAIVFWIESIYLMSLELNLRNVQLNPYSFSINYRLSVIFIVVLTVDVLIVESIMAIFAASQLASYSRTPNSTLDVHINMLTLVASIICVGLSCYALVNSISRVTEWTITKQTSVSQLVVFYGIGLKELIVCSYAMMSCVYGIAMTVFRRKSLRIGAIFTQGISLFIVLHYLLNSDRISAVIYNTQRMLHLKISTPFGGEILLILYAFIAILGLALLVQLSSTIINVFPFAPVDVLAAPLNLPYSPGNNKKFSSILSTTPQAKITPQPLHQNTVF